MRFDLHDLYKANPRVFIAVAMVLAAGFALLIVEATGGSGHSGPRSAQAPTSSTVTTTTRAGSTSTTTNGVTTPNPSYHPAYASNVPSTALDQQIASEMGASGSTAATLESVQPASPAWTTDYPPISSASETSEQQYTVAFVKELLDRNYPAQSRGDLARWVSAESAGEMFPGVAARAGDHSLYVELLDPKLLKAPFTLVPSQGQWIGLANQDVRQQVYDLLASPDETWASIVSKGFTSADPLMGVEDVTGMIVTTAAGRRTVRHFSTQVELGSALHHPGYGAWGIGQWDVS